MTKVAFLTEQEPLVEAVAAWHEQIRDQLRLHSAEVFEWPLDDVNTYDGFLIDVSAASSARFNLLPEIEDTGKSALVVGLAEFLTKEVVIPPKLPTKFVSKISMDLYIGMFLRSKLGLSLPVEYDRALMPMDDPATWKILQITKAQAAEIRQMEIDDEY